MARFGFGFGYNRKPGFSVLNVINDGNTVGWYDASDLTTITKDGNNNVSVWGDKLELTTEGAEWVLYGNNEVQKATVDAIRCTTVQSNEQAHGGTYSSKVVHNIDVGLHYLRIPVTASLQYEVSIWVYIPSGQAHVDSVLLGSAGVGNYASTNLKDQWVNLIATFSPSYDSISVSSGTSDSNGEYYYFDDFTIKEPSVNHNLLQSDPAKCPIYSSNGISFDGSNDYLQSRPFTLEQPISLYAVVKANTLSSNTLLDSVWRASIELVGYFTNYRYYLKLNTIMSTINLSGYDYFVFRLVINGNNSYMQINDYTAEITDTGSVNMDGLTLGAKYNFGQNYAISYREIILRKGVDSAGTSNRIYNYFVNKHKDKLKLYGNFIPYAVNPILTPTAPSTYATFASVLKVSSTYHMYYHATINDFFVVSHATSSDGKAWNKDTGNDPVLTRTVGEWDEYGVGVPIVWKEDSVWYMLYRGAVTSGGLDAMGLATSSDGITWTKDANNPVLEPGGTGTWDVNGAEGWGLIKIDATYYLFYESSGNNGRAIGIATSTDLITWTKDVNNPIMDYGRFCPNIFKYDSYYYLLVPHYGYGADYSEIEIYRDTNPTFYVGDREYLGSIKKPGLSGEWDATDEDTPWVLTDDIFRNTFAASNNEIWCYYSGDAGNNNWGEGLLISKNFPV